jgi:putative transcriptional regulator
MIKNNLSKLLGERRMKMTELCRLTGLSKNTVFRMYHAEISNFNLDTIDKICKELKCNTQDLFEFISD